MLRPRALWQARLCDVVLVVCGSLLIGLAAQWTIPLPWVPVTGQTFAVLLLGALLGARLGPMTVLLYLAEGASGLPVFSQGRGGPAVLLGPTGGYLVGFVAAAYVVGLLAQRGWDRRFHTTLAAMALGNAALYAFGLAWLWLVWGMNLRALVGVGLIPFIPGDLVKACLAAVLLPAGWRVARRFGPPRIRGIGQGLS
ncbi:MAG: biotin transporter BioY [Phycisphaerae bacterium]|nr:biotin transporter BioY [Phycisphaerae bacterium]